MTNTTPRNIAALTADLLNEAHIGKTDAGIDAPDPEILFFARDIVRDHDDGHIYSDDEHALAWYAARGVLHIANDRIEDWRGHLPTPGSDVNRMRFIAGAIIDRAAMLQHRAGCDTEAYWRDKTVALMVAADQITDMDTAEAFTLDEHAYAYRMALGAYLITHSLGQAHDAIRARHRTS